MSRDSIENILNDCTMSPKAYCMMHDCGQGIYDELADYVPDMCIHLVGRTEAVMRHEMLSIFDADHNTEFHIGDRVMRKNGRTGEVIGYAMGKDEKPCLVLSMHDGHWKTYLCPVDEAMHLKVPSLAELRREIEKAIRDAADGTSYTYAQAEQKADWLVDLAHAHFTHSEFPFQ